MTRSFILDTSAVIAVCLAEPAGLWVLEHTGNAERMLMSNVNLAECAMVLRLRSPDDSKHVVERLLESGIEFVAPDVSCSMIAAEARSRYPFNFGDCFAYALAKQMSLPLVTLDRDFLRTDVVVHMPDT